MKGSVTVFLRRVVVLPLVLYQKLISPLLPASCIYTPTCSQYAVQAISTLGVFRGGIASILRVFRCVGAIFEGGQDPVPESFSLGELLSLYRRHWRRRTR